MLYDEASLESVPHQELPMPTLEELARHDEAPTDEVLSAIRAAAEKMGPDAYWIHAEVHQQYPSVTIGQVARVLLDRL